MTKQTFTTGQVLTAAQMTSLQQTAMGGGSTTAKTASYVLVAADAGTVVQMNAAGATTITVNTALFAAGDTVQIQNVGAGVCTVTAGTATVSTSATLALKQYDAGTLYFNTTSAAFFFAVDAADTPLTTTGDIIYSSSGSTAARLGIGSSAQVLTVASGIPSWATPASPSFVGCALYNSAAISIASATVTTVLWNSEDFDTDSFHSTVTNTGRITIPSGKDGKYLFIVTTLFDVNATGFRSVRFNKNGSVQNYLETQPGGTGNGGVSLSAIYNLVATDYIEAAVEQTSGGALNVKTLSRFQCVYLGA